jgi:hypothetical protein
MAMAVEATQADQQYVTVSGGGSIVTGGNNPLALNVLKDHNGPVFIAGRLVSTDGAGAAMVTTGTAFYLPQPFSTTKYDPGYFTSLSEGAMYPIGGLEPFPAGDMVTLQITVFDSQNGGAPIQNVFTTFWSNARGTNPIIPVILTNAAIASGVINLTGRFPTGQQLTLLVGQPGWDTRVVQAVSKDGKTVSFPVPADERGLLYPAGASAQSPWSFVLTTADGNAYSFPNAVMVQGSLEDSSVTVVQ